jgi:sugar phosphate isomerase/epimerase
VLAASASAGFAFVGVDDVSVRGRSDAEVAASLRAHALNCTDVGVLRLGADDPRAAACRLASLARATGASTCIAAVMAGDRAATRRDLLVAADVLGPAGVRIALEHAAYGALRTLREAVDLCDAVGSERCGVLVDAWHVLRGEGEWDLLRALDAEQIALVHLSDAPTPIGGDVAHESRFRRLPPGRGELDLPRFIGALHEVGYEGVVSLEVLSADLRSRDPTSAARELHVSFAALLDRDAVRSFG